MIAKRASRTSALLLTPFLVWNLTCSPLAESAVEQTQCVGFRCGVYESTMPDTGAADDCRSITLELRFDEKRQHGSSEIHYTLVCDQTMLWDNAILPSDVVDQGKQEEVCVDFQSCCRFLFREDGNPSSGSGETELILRVEGEETLQKAGHFSVDTLEKIFGGSCPQKSIEEDEPIGFNSPDDSSSSNEVNIECKNGEELIALEISMDEYPEEISWFLICEDIDHKRTTVWVAPHGSLEDHPNANLERKACLSTTSTCVFTIVDSGGGNDEKLVNGSDDTQYTLTYASEVVGSFGEGGSSFSDLSHCVGPKCSPYQESNYWDTTEEVHVAEEPIVGCNKTIPINKGSSSASNADTQENQKEGSRNEYTPHTRWPKRENSLFDHGTDLSTTQERLEYWMYSLIGSGCVLLFLCLCCCATMIHKQHENDPAANATVRDMVVVRKILDPDNNDDNSTTPSDGYNSNTSSSGMPAEEQC